MISVEFYDDSDGLVEVVSGNIKEITERTVNFARDMINDGIGFRVDVVHVDKRTCGECGPTPEFVDANGVVLCAVCDEPYQRDNV